MKNKKFNELYLEEQTQIKSWYEAKLMQLKLQLNRKIERAIKSRRVGKSKGSHAYACWWRRHAWYEYKASATYKDIANKYGVKVTTVRSVINWFKYLEEVDKEHPDRPSRLSRRLDTYKIIAEKAGLEI